MEKTVLAVIIGLALVYVSYLVAFKGKIEIIHSYHYKNVKKENIGRFSKLTGLAILLVSIGILIMPLVNTIMNSNLGNILGFIVVCLGIAMLLYTTIKYNESLFRIKKRN